MCFLNQQSAPTHISSVCVPLRVRALGQKERMGELAAIPQGEVEFGCFMGSSESVQLISPLYNSCA